MKMFSQKEPSRKLYPNKFLGQNFLIDKNVLAKIIAAAELKPTDTVVEIGAGTGVLTTELAKRAGRVVAFEIDKRLIPVLRENVGGLKNVEIVEKDILSYNLKPVTYNLKSENAGNRRQQVTGYRLQATGFKVVANIPYNITSAILEKFLSAEDKPSLMVLLVQKEVAERVCARPGEMSVLSVMVQYYGKPEIVATVPSSAFWPQPKVDSAILKIRINPLLISPFVRGRQSSCPLLACPAIRRGEEGIKGWSVSEFEKFFFQIVKAGFSRRRKMLKNNLVGAYCNTPLQIVDILTKIGLSSTVRAQELGVEEWVKLTLAFLSNSGKIK